MSLLLILFIVGTSCQKQYTCNCVFTDNATGQIKNVPNDYGRIKKEDAESNCESLEVSVPGSTGVCELSSK